MSSPGWNEERMQPGDQGVLRERDDMWGTFSFLTFVKIPTTSDPWDIAPQITDNMTANHEKGNAKIELMAL